MHCKVEPRLACLLNTRTPDTCECRALAEGHERDTYVDATKDGTARVVDEAQP